MALGTGLEVVRTHLSINRVWCGVAITNLLDLQNWVSPQCQHRLGTCVRWLLTGWPSSPHLALIQPSVACETQLYQLRGLCCLTHYCSRGGGSTARLGGRELTLLCSFHQYTLLQNRDNSGLLHPCVLWPKVGGDAPPPPPPPQCSSWGGGGGCPPCGAPPV